MLVDATCSCSVVVSPVGVVGDLPVLSFVPYWLLTDLLSGMNLNSPYLDLESFLDVYLSQDFSPEPTLTAPPDSLRSGATALAGSVEPALEFRILPSSDCLPLGAPATAASSGSLGRGTGGNDV